MHEETWLPDGPKANGPCEILAGLGYVFMQAATPSPIVLEWRTRGTPAALIDHRGEPPGGPTMFGALGQPGPPTPHFYRQEPLTFIDRALASPAPKPSLLSTGTPHFYRRGPASPAPNPSLLLANPSLLLARPLTSIGQTPHFYWRDPSLLLANPSLLLAGPLTSIGQTPHFY